MSIQALRQQFPLADERSEQAREEQFGIRYGGWALAMAPHWEKCWSLPYALDRLRWLHDHGFSVNYSRVATDEPGLAGYLRRVYGSWDQILAAVGLDPLTIRLARAPKELTRDEVLAGIKRLHEESPSRLHIRASRVKMVSTLVTAGNRHFGSWQSALEMADIDPLPFIPALADPGQVSALDQLIGETRYRLSNPSPYELAAVKSFLDRHETAVKEFFGVWANFAIGLGFEERDLFNPPDATSLTTAQVISQIQERHAAGLSLRQGDVIVDHSGLSIRACKLFGNWKAALGGANVERQPRMIKQRHYTPESLLESLRQRAEEGKSLKSSCGENLIRRKWALRYYGGWRKALLAAGVQREKRKRPPYLISEKRFANKEEILEAIRQRHAEGKSLFRKVLKLSKANGGDIVIHLKAVEEFGCWGDAVEAAGLPRELAKAPRSGWANVERGRALKKGQPPRLKRHGKVAD
jgi:hypothetical protein